MAKPGRRSPGLDDYLYWQERLASRETSGLSIDAFCADEDVSRSNFYRWVGRLKDGIPDAVKEEGAALTLAEIAEPKFLPVSVTASPVEIELPNGGGRIVFCTDANGYNGFVRTCFGRPGESFGKCR